MKNVLGHQAYILESIKSLSTLKPYKMTVKCNDMEIKGDYIYGMISNSFSVGGMKGIVSKDVELDDGLFEVCLVREAKTPLELQQIVAGLFSKTQKSPMVERFKTKKVVFESEQAVAWTVDGENADAHERVEINVIPRAVDIIVNK